jgi:DNA-binding NtrC family response regulator
MAHTVLIIEDDTSTRSLLEQLLQAEGYQAITAADGAEGVRQLVEQKPCVILLDFEMPIMDGHDFREVQKRLAPDVPIICLTGAAQAEQTARLVGASSVFPKPLDLDALRETIARFCSSPHTHRHAANVESAIERGR